LFGFLCGHLSFFLELCMSEVAALEQALGRQRQREARRWRFLLAFVVLIVVSLLLDIATGPTLVPARLLHSYKAQERRKDVRIKNRTK
jgi:hypothetical protein